MSEACVAPTLSIVSPVYGCADCLGELCARIGQVLQAAGLDYEIVLVCDASPDASWARMRELASTDPRIRGVRFSRNFGQHVAISAGLKLARGQWVVVLDCDLQDQPEAIPALYQQALQGHDAVVAARKDRQDGWFKRLGSRAFYAVLSYLTGEAQDASTANYGIYSRRLVDTLNSMPESGRFFPLMVRWTGFARTTMEVQHAARCSGRSGYTLLKMLRLAQDVITSYSDRPLRLLAGLGLAFSAISLLFAAYSIWRWFAGDIAVAGFTSIIASIWLVGGVVIACLGVVGLYVGRIFNETKRRPHFVIAERLNLLEPAADDRPV